MNILDILKILFVVTIAFDIIIFIIYFWFSRLKLQTTKIFGLLFATVIVWETLLWIEFFVNTPTYLQLPIDQFAFATGVCIVLLSLLFSWQITNRAVFSKRSIYVITSMYILIALITLIPGLVLQGREYFSSAPYDYKVISGPLLNLFYISVSIAPILIGIILWKGYKIEAGLDKLRIGIVGFGIFVMIFFATSANVWIQLVAYFIQGGFFIGSEFALVITQVSSGILISFFSFTTLYAIGRYRFLGLRIVLKKSVFIFITVLLLGILFSSILIFLLSLYRSVFSVLFASLTSIFIGVYIKKWLSYILDGLTFFEEIDFSHTLSEEAKQLDSEHKTKTYILEIVSEIQQKVVVDVLSVFVPERQRNRFYSYYPQGSRESISFQHPAFQIIEKSTLNSTVLLKEKCTVKKVRKLMRRYNAEVLLIVHFNGQIKALLFLSGKKDGSDFSEKEIEYFNQFINSAGPEFHSLIYWYETIEGMKRKLHNDVFEI